MASRKHLVAVNRTIRAAGLEETGIDAAIVELARDYAREMDAAIEVRPLNLVRGYQSALKDLQRAAERRVRAPKSGRDAGEPGVSGTPSPGTAPVNDLDAWRTKQGH